MDFRTFQKNFLAYRPDQLLFLSALLLTLLALVTLWIDIRLGLSVMVCFIAVSYIAHALLIRVQQRKVLTVSQRLEALVQLNNLIAFRLPLPPLHNAAAAPDLLLLLCREILTRQPQCLVECGAGVSTIVIGYLLEKLGQGQLVTLEHEVEWAERVSQWVEQHHLEAYVKVVYAPLAPNVADGTTYEWYDADIYQPVLKALPPIELLFVDGPPNSRQKYARLPAVPCLRPMLSPHCVIIMDDTERETELHAAHVWADKLHYRLDLFTDFQKGAAILQPPTPVQRGAENKQAIH